MHWTSKSGLYEIGNGTFAYLQQFQNNSPWGWSNTGLIVNGEQALLIDTLYDLPLTKQMHDTMSLAVPAAAHIDTLINTHSNGDHTHGNQLFADATILTSLRAAQEMREELDPAVMENMARHSPAGSFFARTLEPFDFRGIVKTYPTETFEVAKIFDLNGKVISLVEVGPAHTKGDILIFVPEDKICYTGDIIFNDSHPVIWAGPVHSWIRACEMILAQDVEVIVPGHGPIGTRDTVREIQDYLSYIYEQAKQRHDGGMSMLEAAYDISLERYASWLADERMIPNVAAVYRELDNTPQENMHKMLVLMDEWTQKRRNR